MRRATGGCEGGGWGWWCGRQVWTTIFMVFMEASNSGLLLCGQQGTTFEVNLGVHLGPISFSRNHGSLNIWGRAFGKICKPNTAHIPEEKNARPLGERRPHSPEKNITKNDIVN